jgi:cytochrome P450 PksS
MTTGPETHDETIPEIFRLVTSEFLRDPHPTLTALRESGPAAVPIVENGFRMWLVTRDADVRRVLTDPSLGKNLLSVADEVAHCKVRPDKHAKLPRPVRSSMLEQDGDNHRRLRGMLSHVFTPRQVAKLRPAVNRVADGLLSGLPTDKPVDLLRDYTRPLATTVLCDLVGVPPGWRDDFPHWQNSVLTGGSPQESTDAAKKLYAFSQEIIDLKGREPQDDLFTELVELERYGDMSAQEAVATVFMVLIGGLEPSYAAANGALTLLRNPGELTKVLAEPTLWPACVDEILRYEPSFRILGPRHCPASVELGDVTIPPHELIITANSSANRDPSRFDHPDEFDISRKSNDHLSFGHGPHRCIGAALGKLEMEVALDSLFTRFPHAALALAPSELRWRPSTFLRRLDSLPVLLGRAARETE